MSPLPGILVTVWLTMSVHTLPQSLDCHLFDSCEDSGGKNEEDCFNSLEEINNSIIGGDTRSAYSDCDEKRKCSYYAREGFACADPWTCTENRTIITDGKGLIDVRQASAGVFTLDASDRKCDNENKICCQRPNFRAPPPGEPTSTTIEVAVKEKDQWAKCGRHNEESGFTGDSEEVAAERAGPTEFPHMCVIYRMIRGQRAYIGGASLIARNKVLTVAHKFLRNQGEPFDGTQNPKEYRVRCGQYNLKKEDSVLPFQESGIEQILLHPDYDERKFVNNLAILRTEANFFYQLHIGPVCLPRPYEDFTTSDKGSEERCWSSGWGANQFEQGIFSDFMKKVNLGVVPRNECQTRLKNTDRFRNSKFQLDNSWMCIGGEEGRDTCKGDGGSPHVCMSLGEEQKWIQVGAVAWGVECGHPVPAVYSSIPDAMCWIDWVMSCKPEADKFINRVFEEEEEPVASLFDLRTDTANPDSVNSITVGDCQGWLDDHPSLKQSCNVRYTSIEERTNDDDHISAIFD